MPDPISRGNCNLWFDASDASTITVATDTTLVTQWNDKSGNARNATATTTARPNTMSRYLNGHNVLDFDGVANTMRTSSFTQNAVSTCAIVFLSDNGANSAQENFLADVTNGQVIGKTTGNVYQIFNGAGGQTAGTVNLQAHSIICVGSTTGVGVINVDGTDLATTLAPGSAGWAGGFQIGSSATPANFFNGAIAEIVTYSNAVSVAQRAQLSLYFYNKWFARSMVPMQATLLQPKTPTLLPTERFVRLPGPVTLTTITGTSSTTNANDTSAAAGTTTVTGTLAKTNANDTLAATGSAGSVSGTLATTNANDTLAAAGTTTVTGSLAKTNNNDTSVGAGTTKILGTSSTTNNNDTLAATGTGNTNFVPTPPSAQQVGGTLSGRRGPYTAIDAELEAILHDDDEILVLL